MPRKSRKVQLPVLIATALIALGGAAALVKLEHVANAAYWVSGATLLVPVVLSVGGGVLRTVKPATSRKLDGQVKDLREMVLAQWSQEVAARIFRYPLPVPFSVTTTVELPAPPTETSPVIVQVMDSWDDILQKANCTPPDIDGTFDSIADVFRTEGLRCRLVVLGEPGGGKSILAQSLTVKLLEAQRAGADAHDGPSAAIPVLLQLRTWDPDVDLKEWAAGQLTRSYPWLGVETQGRGGATRTLAQQLIEQNRVLMVLDGLDEINPENRLAAFRKLAASKGRSMVITCRTKEYAQIVYQAGEPLPQIPVIRLSPLPLADVRTCLVPSGRGPSPRFGQLMDHVELSPDEPLAQVLRSPLALWLATTVYKDPRRDPMELTRFQTKEQILKHLLDGLVGAVYTASYSTPTGTIEGLDDDQVALAHKRLCRFADYLGTSLERQSIDWWRLPAIAPAPFVGGVIGGLVGCVLGAAVGLAAAARFGSHWGVLLGIAFGIITGVLSGVTSVRPQERPRTVDVRFRWDYWRFVGCLTVGILVGLTAGYADHRGGGLLAGLITAAVVGPACAVPCVVAFGWAPGVTAGITASVALGLSSGLSQGNGHPIWSGLGAGLVFFVSAWIFVGIFQPAQDKFVVSPQSLLDRDRIASLVVAATAGVAFGVVFGIALGPLFAVVALVALIVSVALTVSMWGAFTVCRVWLALTGMCPLGIMSFLNEAYVRGVLRQVGGSYQFRHTELKEALIAFGRPDAPEAPQIPGQSEPAEAEQITAGAAIEAESAAERIAP